MSDQKPWIPWTTERADFLRHVVEAPSQYDDMVRDLAAEVLHLREQLGRNRCNSGHETLPLTLWNCPACTEQTEADLRAAKAHAADLQGEIARLQEALRISKLRSDELQQQRDAAQLLADHRFEERDRIAIVEGKLRAAIQAAGFAVMETSGAWSIHDTREPKRPEQAIETAMRRLRAGLGIATFDVLEPQFRLVLEHLVDDVATRAKPEYWLIRYEDRDVGDEVFTDEAAARARYEGRLTNWNCHLFASVVVYRGHGGMEPPA